MKFHFLKMTSGATACCLNYGPAMSCSCLGSSVLNVVSSDFVIDVDVINLLSPDHGVDRSRVTGFVAGENLSHSHQQNCTHTVCFPRSPSPGPFLLPGHIIHSTSSIVSLLAPGSLFSSALTSARRHGWLQRPMFLFFPAAFCFAFYQDPFQSLRQPVHSPILRLRSGLGKLALGLDGDFVEIEWPAGLRLIASVPEESLNY